MPITLNGTGTVTGISAGGISDTKAIATAAQPAGSILQVVQTTKTDTSSFSSTNTNTFVDLTGLSVSITPSATTSKVLIIMNPSVSMAAGTLHIRLLRGSTDIFQGDSGGGNRLSSSVLHRSAYTNHYCETLSGTFLDSPNTTSATTYKLQATLGATYNSTVYINRTVSDSNHDYSGRVVSTITAIEVAA
tara:strand:+ start:24 stop:593 length:570 start_codon:yes stop_codon:yes gene_type:complete